MTVGRTITHCRQPRLDSPLVRKHCETLPQLSGLIEANHWSPELRGPQVPQWTWGAGLSLLTSGDDLHPRVEISAAAGISVFSPELRLLQWRRPGLRWCSKCHLQAWHKELSLSVDVCNPQPRRGDLRKCLPVCSWVSLHFLLRGVLSGYKGLPPPTPLGGEPAEGRKPLPSPHNTQAWCYGLWWWWGFHWSMYLREKTPKLLYMPHAICALQEGWSPGSRAVCWEVWVCQRCPEGPS